VYRVLYVQTLKTGRNRRKVAVYRVLYVQTVTAGGAGVVAHTSSIVERVGRCKDSKTNFRNKFESCEDDVF